MRWSMCSRRHHLTPRLVLGDSDNAATLRNMCNFLPQIFHQSGHCLRIFLVFSGLRSYQGLQNRHEHATLLWKGPLNYRFLLKFSLLFTQAQGGMTDFYGMEKNSTRIASSPYALCAGGSSQWRNQGSVIARSAATWQPRYLQIRWGIPKRHALLHEILCSGLTLGSNRLGNNWNSLW